MVLLHHAQCLVSPKSRITLELEIVIPRELVRKKCIARTNSVTFTKINQIVRGWINYFRIGRMRAFIEEFGQWLRHKIRVIILKQWKLRPRIYQNLKYLNDKYKYNLSEEVIYSSANARVGLYKQAYGYAINFILNSKILEMRKGDRPGLVNPLEYYLR